MNHPRARIAAAVFATAGMLLLSACGSGDRSAAGDATATSAADPAKAEIVAAAQQRIDQALRTTADDIQKPPTEPFDPGTKKVMVISCSQAAAACAAESAAVVEAAELAGWTPSPILDSEFRADKVAGFVNEAINQKYDAIVYASANPNDIVDTARAAADAGIVQVAFNNPVGDALKDAVIQVTPDNVQRGHLIGDWIITQSNCKGTVQVYDDPAYPVSTLQVHSVVEQLQQCGDSIEMDSTDIATSDLAKPGPPFWTAALAQNPRGSMDFAVTPYDSVSAPMARTAADQGREDVKITGFDGAPENVKLIASGEQAVSVTSPFGYLGYVAIDQAARRMAGLPLYDATAVPARLVTADNAASFPNFWEPEGFDYKAMFAGIWGKK
ncbi:hypothetical protein PSU4_31910 [Pseudonocardia sulfidoxydans NBRC 16205]|uniref:Periplasmic binding protein domain-containing protein n=1 Tax=Pseudonocardia sulfidoxydans NBRC 16205 TaxID=1223511 RepID=A0A511DIE5_9PSEU|nr:substrate-binding domain-containing protein [Pseudonocardia sulfidoxydans]GEL24237.1 hypothetical protein PSU4_31910 [Pseudonocardia sulfidoxydans NBRC 16205]